MCSVSLRAQIVIIGLAFAVASTGCEETTAPVECEGCRDTAANRPSVECKDDFTGTWLHSVEVVSVETDQDWLEPPTGSPPAVITWTIDHDYLLAVPEGGSPEDVETLPAAFRIDSHFEPFCDEHRSTVSDDCFIDCYDDPYWFERPMMRVDWSTDFVADAATLGLDSGEGLEIQSAVILEHAAYEDARDPASLILERFVTTTTYVITGPPERCGDPRDGTCSAIVVAQHSFVRIRE
jgi:hypothetical protein